jgi:selenide,water dikinase
MLTGNASAEIYTDNFPHLNNVKHYIDDDWITGGGKRNRDFAGTRVDTNKIPLWKAELMFDPQTSGGLLLAVKAEQADDLLKSIQTDDPKAAIVGCIMEQKSCEVAFC